MPGSGGRSGDGAGGQHELVVGLDVLAARRELAHGDGLRRAVDRQHLVPGAHVEGEGLPQALRGLQQQRLAILDVAADVVRQAAVGERDVVVALEDDDVGALIEPAQARGSRHPAGDAADDHNLHGEPFSATSRNCERGIGQ